MKKRERFLDIAKRVAILCIVLLHVENGVIPNGLNTFIGSFMISLFFVTTGWLDGYRTEPLKLKELCSKRWKQLGLTATLKGNTAILLTHIPQCALNHMRRENGAFGYFGGRERRVCLR